MEILRNVVGDVLKPVLRKVAEGLQSPILLTVEFTTTQFDFKFKAPSTSTLNIYDGDGTLTAVAGNDDTLVTHTTSYVAPGTYYFYVEGDWADITQITLSPQNNYTCNISRWSEMPNMTVININNSSGIGAYGSIDSFGVFVNLLQLSVGIVAVTGNIENLSTCISLISVNLKNSGVGGNFASLAELPLIAFNAFNSQIEFNSIVEFSDTIKSLFYFYDCEWTSTMVDNCLLSLAAGGVTGATIKIGGTNAARTSASDAAFAYLDANNTLEVNS